MGMDLSGPAGDFFWDFFSWPKLLRVARRYGWEPAGTVTAVPASGITPSQPWDGNYFSNDDQIVTAADAWQLAAALDRALADIPDDDVLAPHRLEGGGMLFAPNPPEIDDLDWFCGSASKDNIRAFVHYCRAGAFSIQ